MTQSKSIRTLTRRERKAFRNAYRGAVFLDEQIGRAKWRSLINLVTLDLTDGECCVLGQCYPHRQGEWDTENGFGRGASDLFPMNIYGHVRKWNQVRAMGFASHTERGAGADFDHLQRAWLYLLPRWEVQ